MKSLCKMLSSLLLLLLILEGLLTGCKGGFNSPSTSLQKVMASKIPSENLFVAEDYGNRQPLSVAVLPFDNQTQEPEAAELLRKLFYNNFSSLSYNDIEFSKVDTALPDFDPAANFDAPDTASICSKLQADAIIVGRVTQFETLYAGLYASFSVAFELKMLAAQDDQLLWSVKHHETQRSGKVPLSPVGAIIAAATTAMDLSRYNMINTSNKLCQASIETIPPSNSLKGQSYPRIFTLAHDGVNRFLKKGDQLQVGMEGSPGLKASFVIAPRNTPIAMQEKESGAYVGTYIVREGDELADGQIIVTLTDQWNNACRWEDTLGLVTLDGVAPEPPTGIKTVPGDGKVSLRWNSSAAKDLSGYQILRSKTPLSGYAEIAKTEFTRYEDAGLENNTTYFYRIVAQDKAGNSSTTMTGIPATPVPPGPTLVSGELGADTVWHPGGNPYFIDEEATLPAGNRLRIEAGVAIKAAETARFLIKGQLTVNGEANAPVLFSADHEGGTWEGLVFDHSEEGCSLNHFEISEAVTGLSILNASPSISSGTVKQCKTGFLISGEKAAPQLKNITVYRNRNNGIISKELAQPIITTSKIAYNGGVGLELFQSDGKILGNEISYNHLGVQMSQSQAVVAGNRIQYNTHLDLKSVQTPMASLKVDLNYFGNPEKVVVESSEPDGENLAVTVLETPDVRGSRKMVTIGQLPESEGPFMDQTLRIKGDGMVLSGAVTPKDAAPIVSEKEDEKSADNHTEAAESTTGVKEKESDVAPNALDAFIQGINLARKEAYPEAITFLTQALKETAREAEVRFWLGFCYMQSGQTKHALFNYNKAVKLDPKNIEYLLHLGTALHLNNNPQKAKVVYQEVLRRDPQNQDAKNFLQLLEEKQ